jgi:tape measure domain-containing protein
MNDTLIGLGIADQFSAPLKQMAFLMATVENATSASAKQIDTLEKTAARLGGTNAAFKDLSDSVSNFAMMAQKGGNSGAFYKQMVDDLGAAQKSVAPAVNSATAAIAAQDQQTQKSSASVKDMAVAFTAASFATGIITGAISSLSNVIMSIPSQAMALNASFEQTRIAFTTLLGSAQDADVFLKQMWDFAAVTPFEFPELTQAARRMKAFGFETEQILPIMTAVGNISAAMGGSSELVARMTYSLGQMKAMGRVTGMELRELAMAGVNLGDIYAKMAVSLGKTTEEVKAMMSGQGGATALPFDTFLKAFEEVGTSGKFLGAMDMQAKTFNGAMSTIKDNISAVIRDGFKPLFEWVSKLTYQFSVFVQSADFQKITARVAEGMAKIAGGLPVLSADTFAGFIDGALKAVDALMSLVKIIADNLIPILAGLSAAVATTALALTVGLAGATGGLSLVVPALALAIGGLVKAILELNKLGNEANQQNIKRAQDVKDYTASLGNESTAYIKLADRERELLEIRAQTLGRGGQWARSPFADELVKIQNEMEKYEATLDAVREAEERVNRERQKSNFAALRQVAGPGFASPNDMVIDPGIVSAIRQITDEMKAIAKSVDESMTPAIQKIIDGFVNAGSMTRQWGKDLLASFNMSKEPAQAFNDTFTRITELMGGLSVAQQATFLKAAVNIKKAADESGDWTKGLVDLEDILGKVDAAAKKAADAQRWTDMFMALASGMAGPMDAYYKKLAAPPGKTNAASDYRDVDLDIEQNLRKIEEAEERKRRALQQSSDASLNYKQKDVEAAKQEDRAIEQLILKNEQLAKKKQDMAASDAKVANQPAEDYQQMLADYGEYINKWILGQEQMGKISKETADVMLAANKASLGVGLSKGEEWQRSMQEQTKRTVGLTGDLAAEWVKVVAESVKAENPAKALEEGTTALLLKQKQMNDAEKNRQKLLADNGELIDKSSDGVGNIETALDSANKTAETFYDYMNDSNGLIKLMTDVIHKVTFQVEVIGGGGVTGSGLADKDSGDTEFGKHKEGDPAGKGMVYHWNGSRWVFVRGGQAQSEGTGPQGSTNWDGGGQPRNLTNAATTTAAAAATAQQVINSIQEILSLFSGLSIDPRLKDMADIVDSVISAFAQGLEALSSLKEFTAPARANVDAAFAEIIYIHGRVQDYIVQFAGCFDNKKLGEVASMASDFLSAFGTGVEALKSLKEYVAPARSAIDSALNDMKYIVQQLATEAGNYSTEGLAQAKLLAETLSAIGSAVGASVSGLRDALTFPTMAAETPFANFSNAMQRWLTGLVHLGKDYTGKTGEDALKAARDVASTIEAIGGALGAAVGPMAEALRFPALIGASPFGNISDALQRWLRGLAWMSDPSDPANLGYDPARIGTMAAVIEQIGNGLSAVTQALKDALTFPAMTSTTPFANIGTALQSMITTMGEWATSSWGQQAAGLVGFASMLASVIAPFQDIISVTSALVDLARKAAEGSNSLTAGLVLLDNATRLIFDQLAEWMLPTWEGPPPAGVIQGLAITQPMIDFAENLSKVLAPFQTIISVVSGAIDLADRVGTEVIGFDHAIGVMNIAVQKLVLQMKQWWFGGGAMQISLGPVVNDKYLLIEFADNLSKLLAPFQTIISVVSGSIDLADKVGTELTGFGQAMVVMNNAVQALVLQMKRWWFGDTSERITLGPETTEGKFPLIIFAENLSKLLAPFQTIISIVSGAIDLADKVGTDLTNFTSAMTVMNRAVQALVLQMKRWWFGAASERITLGTEVEGKFPLITFAENLSKLLAPFQTIISVVSGAIDLAEKVGTDLTNFTNAMTVMNRAVQVLVLQMKRWWFGAETERISLGTKTAEGEYPLITFADNLSKLLAPFQTIISVVSGAIDLADKVGTDLTSFTQAMTVMNTAIRAMIDQLTMWMTGGLGNIPTGAPLNITQPMIDFAESLSKVLAPMQTAISVVSALYDYAQKSVHNTSQITTILPQFFDDLTTIVQSFVDAAWPDVSGISDDTLQTIGGIVSTMQATVGLLTNLREYVATAHGETVDIPAAVSALVDNLQLAVTEYIAKISTITGIDDIKTETAQTVGAIIDAMTGALALFAGLRGYRGFSAEKLTLFIEDLKDAVSQFCTAINAAAIPELADPAQQGVANTVSAIVTAMGDALGMFDLLREYVDVPQTQMHLFFLDLEYAVTQFVDEVMPPIEAAGVEKAGQVGESIGKIVAALAGAVEFFNAISGEAEGGPDAGFKDVPVKAMDNLKRAIVGDDGNGGIIAVMGAIVSALDTEALANVDSISTSIKDIVEALSGAVAFFRDIDDFTAVPTKAVDNLKKSLIGNDGAGGILKMISDINAAFTTDVVSGVNNFASVVGVISTAFIGAINVLDSIRTYSAPLPAKFQQFVNDLIGGGNGAAATIGVLGLLQQVALAWDTNASAATVAFRDAVISIKQPILDAMAAIAAVGAASGDPIAAINAFIAAMSSVLVNLQTLAGAAGAVDITALLGVLHGIEYEMVDWINEMSRMWEQAGRTWMESLAAGMESAVPGVMNQIGDISDLLPHSPAKTGPLSEPVRWDSYLESGLDSAASMLSDRLSNLHVGGAMMPAAAMGGGERTINIDLSGSTFSSQADEDRMIRKLTDALRRQGVAL